MRSDENTTCLWDALQSPSKEERDAAWSALWNANNNSMYTMSLFLLHNETTAEDAVQEAMCRFGRAIRRIKPRCSPRTYLMRIVHNVCVEWLRKEHAGLHIETIDPLCAAVERGDPRPEEVAMANERKMIVRRAIAGLSELAREAVVLRFVNGFSNEECAETMKVQKNTFEVRLHRAMRILSRILILEEM